MRKDIVIELSYSGFRNLQNIHKMTKRHAILEFLVHRLVIPKSHNSPSPYTASGDCHHQQCCH